jgi:demethylmenaquinone methyltransferase/2-methoxy-6-polyprenyl-1,4-benzoquinol methylase
MSQPPLPPETGCWRRSGDRRRIITALFDRSAAHYDRACRIMSLGSGQTYRRDALIRAGLRDGMRVLDVGTGTGLLAQEIARLVGPCGRIVGVDPSRGMMCEARTVRIDRVQGLGEQLPLADGMFDWVTMGYALRHLADLDQAFAEYRRVLRPGGRVLLLEITRPRSAIGLAVARTYFGLIVPLLTLGCTASLSAASLMRLYWETIAKCVPPEAVLASLGRAQFTKPTRSVVHGIFTEYTACRPV